MSFDNNILLCTVSFNWYQVIKSHYISNGSSLTNCWYTQYEESAMQKVEATPAPGTLTLFVVQRDGKQFVVGGGYFLDHVLVDIDSCWYQYGIRSGYMTYQSFLKRAKEWKADLNAPLSCYLCTGSFIFIKEKILEIPSEYRLDFNNRSRTIISTDEPLGLYLKRTCQDRRLTQIEPGATDSTWPGIYYKASMHKIAPGEAQFKARMLNIYQSKCAITSCPTVPALSVSMIKYLYDDRYLQPNNALLLRSDLQQLFLQGYITVFYDGYDTALVRVSKRIKLDQDPIYKGLEGQKIFLPKDERFRPNREYLEWHNKYVFENWLKYGEFSLIDTIPNN